MSQQAPLNPDARVDRTVFANNAFCGLPRAVSGTRVLIEAGGYRPPES